MIDATVQPTACCYYCGQFLWILHADNTYGCDYCERHANPGHPPPLRFAGAA